MDVKRVLMYSGGVESSYLLLRLLRDSGSFIAVTVDNGLIPRYQKDFINETINKVGTEHVWLQFDFRSIPSMKKNYPSRCYFCKREMFRIVRETYPGASIITGTSSYDPPRPGRMAEMEYNIETPLISMAITRREMMDELTDANLPFMTNNTCLATRFPPFYEPEESEIREVEKIEEELYQTLLAPLRVKRKEDDFILEIEPRNAGGAIEVLKRLKLLERFTIRIRHF